MDLNIEHIEWEDSRFRTEIEVSTIESRKEICSRCPYLSKLKMCSQCGCFMPMKIRLGGFGVKCPLNKW